LTIDQITGPSRTRPLTEARHIALNLCRELTDLSLPSIGREFGGRDHTTVLNGYNRIRENLPEKDATYNKVAELTYRIKRQASA
jgi:chromosomal replication initiator protein